jgi:hypothetical protein
MKAMKKILFLMVIGVIGCTHAWQYGPLHSRFDNQVWHQKGVGIQVTQEHVDLLSPAIVYTFMRLFVVNPSGLEKNVQQKAKNVSSNTYVQGVAARLAQAGVDSVTIAASNLVVTRQSDVHLRSMGTRFAATAATNAGLEVIEKAAHLCETTKGWVESDIYKNYVRPGVQILGSNFIASKLG